MRKSFIKTTVLFFSLFYLVSCSDEPTKTQKENFPVIGCTEIMYNTGTDSLEFVELKIVSGPSIVDMATATLRIEGAQLYAPGESLDTGEYIVVTNDPVLFHSKYPNLQVAFGPWD